MEKMPEKDSPRKPISARAAVSALIWIGLVLTLSVGGLFVWILPGRSDRELIGDRLPPPAAVIRAEGEIVDDGRYVSARRTYFRPRARFAVDGREFEFESVNGYAEDLLPAYPQRGAAIAVVYRKSDPSEAWFAWEFDRLRTESAALSAGRFGDTVRKYYLAASTIIAAASGLFLLINVFFPILAIFANLRIRR